MAATPQCHACPTEAKARARCASGVTSRSIARVTAWLELSRPPTTRAVMAEERLPARSDGRHARMHVAERAVTAGPAAGADAEGLVRVLLDVRRRSCQTEPHHCGARAQKSEEEDGTAAVGVADATPEKAGEQAGEIVRGGKGARREAHIFLGNTIVSDHVRHHGHQEGDNDAVSQRYQKQKADRAEREGRRRGLRGCSAHGPRRRERMRDGAKVRTNLRHGSDPIRSIPIRSDSFRSGVAARGSGRKITPA